MYTSTCTLMQNTRCMTGLGMLTQQNRESIRSCSRTAVRLLKLKARDPRVGKHAIHHAIGLQTDCMVTVPAPVVRLPDSYMYAPWP